MGGLQVGEARVPYTVLTMEGKKRGKSHLVLLSLASFKIARISVLSFCPVSPLFLSWALNQILSQKVLLMFI